MSKCHKNHTPIREKNVFAHNLKLLRTANKLTVVELARAIGISATCIFRYENCHRDYIITDILNKLSEALNVLPDDLLMGNFTLNVNQQNK